MNVCTAVSRSSITHEKQRNCVVKRCTYNISWLLRRKIACYVKGLRRKVYLIISRDSGTASQLLVPFVNALNPIQTELFFDLLDLEGGGGVLEAPHHLTPRV